VLAAEDTSGSAASLASAEAGLAAANAQVQVARANLRQTQATIAAQASTSSQVAAAKAQLATDQAQLTVDQQRLSQANAKLAADLVASPPVSSTTLAADRLAVAQAQQAVTRDQASISTDRQNVASAGSTAVNSSTNQAKLAQSRAQVTQAENGVATAAASVTTAQQAVTSTSITAPVTGVITAVNLTVGQAPPTSAITMRTDGLTVTVDVAEQDVVNLAVGQTAQITLTALNTTVTTKVRTLPTAASSSTGSAAVTFPLTLVLPTTPKGLLPGMSASVSIATASVVNVLSVPTTAIQGTTGANTVQVMRDGSPVSTPVNVGLSTNSSTEIISGVRDGDVVVTGVVNAAVSTTNGNTGNRGGFGPPGGGLGGLTGGGARPGG
jgi:RND family efflux transporter MFP subunit